MPYEMAERFVHPTGTYPAVLVDYEEKPGKWGLQAVWIWETDVEREDEKPARLFHRTGMKFGPKSELNRMLGSIGISCPTTPEQAAQFNPKAMMGLKCRIVVDHDLGNDGLTWANIESFLPPEQVLPGASNGGSKPKAAAEPAGDLELTAAGHDPFQDE